jgi:hypothetical protein
MTNLVMNGWVVIVTFSVMFAVIAFSLRRRNSVLVDLVRGSRLIPPLPSLPIHGLTPRYWDQEAVDRILRDIYRRRPELFVELARLDGANTGREPLAEYQSMRDISGEFMRMGRDEFGVTTLSSHNQLFWEARRRARVMYGLHI